MSDRVLVSSLETDGGAADPSSARRAQTCCGKQQKQASLEQKRATLTPSSPAAASYPLEVYPSEQGRLINQWMDVIGQVEFTLRRFSDSGGIDHVSPEKLSAHLSKLAVKLGNASVEKLTFPFSVPCKSHQAAPPMLVSRSATRVSRLKEQIEAGVNVAVAVTSMYGNDGSAIEPTSIFLWVLVETSSGLRLFVHAAAKL